MIKFEKSRNNLKDLIIELQKLEAIKSAYNPSMRIEGNINLSKLIEQCIQLESIINDCPDDLGDLKPIILKELKDSIPYQKLVHPSLREKNDLLFLSEYEEINFLTVSILDRLARFETKSEFKEKL